MNEIDLKTTVENPARTGISTHLEGLALSGLDMDLEGLALSRLARDSKLKMARPTVGRLYQPPVDRGV